MAVLAGLDPVWQAQNHLRNRQYQECINLCSELLAKHPYDQVEHALLPLRTRLRSAYRNSGAMPAGCVVPEDACADPSRLD